MAEPQEDGQPKRAHLEVAARLSPVARAELVGPKLPEAAVHVWEWFLELNAARSAGEFGVAAITFAELEAWARLTGRDLRPHEVTWLRAIDRLWLATPDKGAKK